MFNTSICYMLIKRDENVFRKFKIFKFLCVTTQLKIIVSFFVIQNAHIKLLCGFFLIRLKLII